MRSVLIQLLCSVFLCVFRTLTVPCSAFLTPRPVKNIHGRTLPTSGETSSRGRGFHKTKPPRWGRGDRIPWSYPAYPCWLGASLRCWVVCVCVLAGSGWWDKVGHVEFFWRFGYSHWMLEMKGQVLVMMTNMNMNIPKNPDPSLE